MRKILNSLYSNIKAGKKSFAVLLDPDKLNTETLEDRINAINSASVDYIFVGGSLISTDNMNLVLEKLRKLIYVNNLRKFLIIFVTIIHFKFYIYVYMNTLKPLFIQNNVIIHLL